ncbi:unnamed protein product [Trichogramma brassicae]|uniref:Uncharacterized protein n=1 Tax=Trichogramma brassicae TaxID=86971 RepID=A0A6H5I9K1_9HYME|nr:unnamed protein product [Trichogramma brassicae]
MKDNNQVNSYIHVVTNNCTRQSDYSGNLYELKDCFLFVPIHDTEYITKSIIVHNVQKYKTIFKWLYSPQFLTGPLDLPFLDRPSLFFTPNVFEAAMKQRALIDESHASRHIDESTRHGGRSHASLLPHSMLEHRREGTSRRRCAILLIGPPMLGIRPSRAPATRFALSLTIRRCSSNRSLTSICTPRYRIQGADVMWWSPALRARLAVTFGGARTASPSLLSFSRSGTRCARRPRRVSRGSSRSAALSLHSRVPSARRVLVFTRKSLGTAAIYRVRRALKITASASVGVNSQDQLLELRTLTRDHGLERFLPLQNNAESIRSACHTHVHLRPKKQCVRRRERQTPQVRNQYGAVQPHCRDPNLHLQRVKHSKPWPTWCLVEAGNRRGSKRRKPCTTVRARDHLLGTETSRQ